jgi:hypothetical protein
VIIGLLTAFGILLVLFGVCQWIKGEAATLPPEILCNKSVLSGYTEVLQDRPLRNFEDDAQSNIAHVFLL